MKNTIYITISCLAVILFASFINSCDKKSSTVDPMNQATVSLTYAPNPIVKNTPVTFTFTVMDGMAMMTDVTDYTCSAKTMISNKISNITLTHKDMGIYSGTCTFIDSDSVMLSFGCMYSGSMMNKDFMCNVK